MKNAYFKLITLSIIFTSLFFYSCDTVNDIFGLEEEVEVYLNPSKYDAVSMEVITLQSQDQAFPEGDEFTGTFDDKEIVVVQSEPGMLYFLIPDVDPGLHILNIDFGDFRGYTDLNIVASPIISNPEEIINEIKLSINNSIQDLEIIAEQTGQKLGDEEKLFLNNTISEFNDVYTSLTDSEKQQFASFIVANPILFINDSSQTKNAGVYLEGFRDFMKANILKVMIAGGSFYLSFTAPEPTGVTKVIALASAAYLVKKIAELGMKVLEIYEQNVVAEQSSLTVNRSEELVFLNHEEIMFDVKIEYRTIFKEDISTTNTLLKEVISLIHKFLDYRTKVDTLIIEFKNLFNISGGGLSPGPKRVSEIESTSSSEVDGDGNLVDIINITNTNVNVAITDKAIGYIIARFSTCEEEYQNFGFTYTYEDPMVDNKDYEALLIATEIIYHEITDSRDGRVYKTIDIGNQTWFAENLDYKGEDGQLGQYNAAYDPNGDIYGVYYEFLEAKEACPPGWHLPSDDDWKQLEMFLGMTQQEADDWYERGADKKLGDVLKSCSGWDIDIYGDEDYGGINSVGFGALPGGNIRSESSGNLYLGYGREAMFWTSDGFVSQYPDCMYRSVGRFGGILRDEQMFHHDMPVRCVKD